MTHDESRLPLTGVRVLELGNFIAAPTAGRLLADFGADVVKVERPRTGDELRRWRLHEGETSLLFRSMNRNKRSVTLDLASPEGRRLALELVRTSDVVLENFRPGTLERWDLGPDRLREERPGLVVVRISGYGQSGPLRDRPGFGGVAEAFGGLRHLTGYPDRPPTRVGVSLADSVAGLYAVIGALLGLRSQAADETGRPGGEVVDVALYEAIYSLTESLVPDFDAFGVQAERTGSSLPGVVPSNSYPCADGTDVVVSGNGDQIFQRLMALVGRDDLAADPGLRENAGRARRADELDEAVRSWTTQHPSADVLRMLAENGVPSGPIYTAADIVEDEHFRARGMLERHRVALDEDRCTEVAFPGVVPRLADGAGRIRALGPDLGEHTGPVLRELGIDDAEVARLSEAGVV